MKRALADSQSTVKNLLYSNQDLKKEILQLKHLYKQDSVSNDTVELNYFMRDFNFEYSNHEMESTRMYYFTFKHRITDDNFSMNGENILNI